MSTQLPALRQANPDLKVKLMEAHNRHPKAIGLYRECLQRAASEVQQVAGYFPGRRRWVWVAADMV